MARGGRGAGTRGRGRSRLASTAPNKRSREADPPSDLPGSAPVEDEVTLLYRRPRGRGRGRGRGGAVAPPPHPHAPPPPSVWAATDTTRSAVRPTAQGVVQMWWRCVSRAGLRHALRGCGLAPTPREEGYGAGAGSEADALVETFFAMGEDRLATALQCAVDLEALAVYARARPVSAAPAGAGGGADAVEGWWIAARLRAAAVALACLCDAVVPMVRPVLVPADVLTAEAPVYVVDAGYDEAGDGPGEVVPMPAVMLAVRERRAALVRLRQLRTAHDRLAPAILQCRTVAALTAQLLSGHPEDALVPLPATPTALHRAEELLLSALLTRACARCELREDAWGPLAQLSPLRLTAGCYVVHPTDRAHALAELLREEADLYGLPPFLRSIRRGTAAWGVVGAVSATDGTAPRTSSASPLSLAGKAAGVHGLVGAHAPHEPLLFPSLRALDHTEFAPPDAAQAPLVAEELLGLTLKHCAFGLVVGEADQILLLLKAWAAYRGRVARQSDSGGVKREGACCRSGGEGEPDAAAVKAEDEESEGEEETDGPSGGRARRGDPMLPFVREAAVRARALRRTAAAPDGGTDGAARECGRWQRLCQVDWLCDGCWAPAAPGVAYYGLVYGVALRSELSEALDGATPTAPVDVDGPHTELEPVPELAYYVSAVIELAR